MCLCCFCACSPKWSLPNGLLCCEEVKLDCQVFFWESWPFRSLSWLASSHDCLQEPTTPTIKNLNLSGHLGKPDQIRLEMKSLALFSKALPAIGAVPSSSRSLGQDSVQPSPCVHLLVCHLSSVLWARGQVGLSSFFFLGEL